MTPLPPEEEARRLLALYGNAPDALARALDTVSRHFNVIQTRSQLLLTLGTVTLTITGFSGPNIARSGAFARASVCAGLALVLLAVLVLLGTLRIRWLTMFLGDDPLATLRDAIRYRNHKTAIFAVEMVLLMLGLLCYVGAVVSYLLTLGPPPGG